MNSKTEKSILKFCWNWMQGLLYEHDALEAFRIRLQAHIENITGRDHTVEIPILKDSIKFRLAFKKKIVPEILVKDYQDKLVLTISEYGPLR